MTENKDLMELLKSRIMAIFEEYNNPVAPVIGGWYLAECDGTEGYKIKIESLDDRYRSSLWFTPTYNTVSRIRGTFTNLTRPLTPDEVKELLVIECKRKYDGKMVRCLKNPEDTGYVSFKIRTKYREESDELWTSSTDGNPILVYHNGTFAEVVEDKVTVGGFEVVANGNGCVIISDCVYMKESIERLAEMFRFSNVTSINWHGEDVTIEKIKRILKMFK